MKQLLSNPLIKNIGYMRIKDRGNYLFLMVGYHDIDIELTIGSDLYTLKIFKYDELQSIITTKHSFESISNFVDTVLNKEYKGYETFYIYSVLSNFTKKEIYKFIEYC